jgi:type III pantothenate kinase
LHPGLLVTISPQPVSAPLLALDCGNTRLKWGLFEAGGLAASGALPLIELAALAGHLPDPLPGRIVVSNVAGERAAVLLRAALESRGRLIHWVRSRAEQCGVRSAYAEPSQLGADRWAALIGARSLHPGPCLAIMAGTATTVDVLDRDGVFQGGLILPGIELMRQSLARNTAQLTAQPGEVVDLPRSTAAAIASGCLQAQLGAVERMFRHIAFESDPICMVSGGAARALFDRLELPKRLEPHLVLYGLARIGEAA